MKHEDKLKIVEKNYRMGKNIVGKSPYSMQVVLIIILFSFKPQVFGKWQKNNRKNKSIFE